MMDKSKLNDAVICKQGDSILEVSRILRDTQCRHLIVVDESFCPKGIVSTVDINNRVVAEKKDAEKTLASDIMTSPIETVDVNESFDNAYLKMMSAGTYSIPVTENGAIIGILDFNQLFLKVKEKANEEH